ncbi:hypothetical protein BDQ17DRAFT_1332571 [Cyathus striatus]|nr:hypothetical protein BDQ17DRAFT_1332571 [Cyathus striatus]
MAKRNSHSYSHLKTREQEGGEAYYEEQVRLQIPSIHTQHAGWTPKPKDELRRACSFRDDTTGTTSQPDSICRQDYDTRYNWEGRRGALCGRWILCGGEVCRCTAAGDGHGMDAWSVRYDTRYFLKGEGGEKAPTVFTWVLAMSQDLTCGRNAQQKSFPVHIGARLLHRLKGYKLTKEVNLRHHIRNYYSLYNYLLPL